MQIIPAIDIKDGNCVRLKQGEMHSATIFSEDPAAMAQHWWPLLRHSFVTLWTTLAGFALAVTFGIALGLVVGWSRTIYRGLYPVMVGFNSIPKVAIVPVLVVWFGIGEIPAILTAFLISAVASSAPST